MQTELLDVINENDEIVESRTREDIHRLGLLHREVHVWLFDENKNIYFSKRGYRKSSQGFLDSPIGGHVDVGEDYASAAIREAKEESGLSIIPSDLVLLTKLTEKSANDKRTNHFSRAIYIYKKPVGKNQLKADIEENEGFYNLTLEQLANTSNMNKEVFHQFILTHEVPLVLKYLNTQ